MLLNYFRQIPVSYGAGVLTVEEASAEFSVHQIQSVVISLEKITVLKSRHFPRDVIAQVNYVNVGKSQIVLSGFSYALVRAGSQDVGPRRAERPIYASFRTAGTSVSGRLFEHVPDRHLHDGPRRPGVTPE